MKVVDERAPGGVLAEERVRNAHDRAVALGENRACPRVRDGQPLGPQRQQVPGGVIVEECVGVSATVVPLPAAGVQSGDGMRVARIAARLRRAWAFLLLCSWAPGFQPSSCDGVMLAPLMMTATRSPGAGLYAPVSRAATPTEAAGSAAMRAVCQSVRCAPRMASSSTSTTSSPEAQ